MKNLLAALIFLVSFQAVAQRPPLKVEVTNPVGAITSVGISGTPTMAISGPVTIANPVTTVGISGTPTMAVNGPVTVANPVTTVGISGTPNVAVSGPVTVANPVTTVSISGTPTMAVSGPVTVANPVTTVGISGIPTVNVNGAVTVANPVTTVGISGTPTVSLNGPVTVGNQYTRIPFAERQRAESFPLSVANYNPVKGTGTLATSSWNVGLNNQTIFNGQKYNSANASANQLMYFSTNGNRVLSIGSITIAVSSTAAATTTVVGSTTTVTPASFTVATTTVFGGTSYTIANNSTITIPGYDLRAPDFLILYLATPAGGVSDTTPVTFVVNVNNAYDMTDDDRPDIQYEELEIGDSITNGTGTVQTTDTWLFALNQYYQNRGYFLRRVNRGEYGKKTDYLAYRIGYGSYNFNAQNVKLITYMAGTNDAILGAVTLTSAQLDVIQANITVAMQWRKTYCPNSVMFVVGAPTISDNYRTTYGQTTAESNLALIRARMKLAVTAWLTANPTDTKLRFIDFGGTAGDPNFATPVIDKTNNSLYSDGLHPNKAGNLLLGQAITNYIDLPANRNVLLPY